MFQIVLYSSRRNIPTLVWLRQDLSQPDSQKKKTFAKRQEAKRKEVECVFGILQGRFNILSIPARSWKSQKMHNVVKAAVILHNMIIQDEKEETTLAEHENLILEITQQDVDASTYNIDSREEREVDVLTLPNSFICRKQKVRNRDEHNRFTIALINHFWNMEGDQ